MNKLFSGVLILFLMLFFPLNCFAKSNYEPCRPKGMLKQEVIASSQTPIFNITAKIGNTFTATTKENYVYNNTLLIPSCTVISGCVIKVLQAKRFPARQGRIELKLSQLKFPDGKIISLEKCPLIAVVVSPYGQNLSEQIISGGLSRVVAYGVTIALAVATSLGGGTVYAIGIGANIIVGALTGIAYPAVGKTRTETAIQNAINATPIGVVKFIAGKGDEANVQVCDTLVLKLNMDTVNAIGSQRFAEACKNMCLK